MKNINFFLDYGMEIFQATLCYLRNGGKTRLLYSRLKTKWSGIFRSSNVNAQCSGQIFGKLIQIFQRIVLISFCLFEIDKGQLNSEWIYEVIVFPNANQKLQGFLPYQTNKDRSQKNCLQLPKNHQKKCYDSCLYGRAEILVIFGLHFGRNDDLINSFWN